MDKICVGLIGHGTVGSGVARVLLENSDIIAKRVGCKIVLKTVLEKNPEQARAKLPKEVNLTDNQSDIFDDNEIQIVIELIGGIEPAKSLIIKALEKGKSVVTANKELIARHGSEIYSVADGKSLDFYFEASVGGGIPIIRPLKESLAANNILNIMGILNGTTNYILTRMEEGLDFDTALSQAQEAGFAEKDPGADIEGRDTASKTAILSSIAFNSNVNIENVYTEGISKITQDDIQYAKELGYGIKLIAVAKPSGDKIDVRVHPTMISLKHPLSNVKENYNAVFIEGDAVGQLMFFGQGAGSMPTASAVVGDIIEIARNILSGSVGKLGCTCFYKKQVKPMDDIQTCYFMRIIVTDKPGVLAKIASVFGDNNVSISKVLQTKTIKNRAEVIFVTHESRESDIQKSISEIEKLDVIEKVASFIRVEGSA